MPCHHSQNGDGGWGCLHPQHFRILVSGLFSSGEVCDFFVVVLRMTIQFWRSVCLFGWGEACGCLVPVPHARTHTHARKQTPKPPPWSCAAADAEPGGPEADPRLAALLAANGAAQALLLARCLQLAHEGRPGGLGAALDLVATLARPAVGLCDAAGISAFPPPCLSPNPPVLTHLR